MNEKLGQLAFGYIVRIIKIVDNCEGIQKDYSLSEFTREQAKISAYNEIASILLVTKREKEE